MSIDISKLAFWSGANYMKRSSLCDNATIAGKADIYTEAKTVSHNFGYVPFTEVFCDINNDGKIWGRSPVDNMSEELDLYSGGLYPRPTFYWITDSTALHIYYASSSSTASTGVIYWLIYLDYGND